MGQIIGGILAENQAIAQRAAKSVKIQYETLDTILTIEVCNRDETVYSIFLNGIIMSYNIENTM